MANVTKLYPDLQKFIDGERDSYENTNGFAFSLEQVGRYADFLDVIAERFFPKAAELRDRLVASMDGASKGDFGAMVDDMAIRRRLGVEIDLDIESYFQFAKILLDKVGHFLEDYFGPGRAASLNSHHKAQKSIESFVAQKQIELPEGMIDRMKALQAISDYRDDKITHLQHARVSRGIQTTWEGGAHVIAGYVNPIDKDKHFQSPCIEKTSTDLKAYLGDLMTIIATNRGKSRYKLAAQPQPS